MISEFEVVRSNVPGRPEGTPPHLLGWRDVLENSGS
jgi:hypothetical protein